MAPCMQVWWRRAQLALVVVIAWLVVRDSVADVNRVSSESMTPTLIPGDRILVDRLSYGLRLPFQSGWFVEWSYPEKGDIVVCADPSDGSRLVKRVVAVAGDQLEMRDGRLWVNGESKGDAPGTDLLPIVVPSRHYFVLGDNRGCSVDSRCFGFVSHDKIAGRVRAVAVSLDPARHHFPRGDRWGRVLR